jgi:hypothetical protein
MMLLRPLIILIISTILTILISSPITTISYSYWLLSIEMPLTLGIFISSLIHDLVYLGSALLPVFLVGFLIAFVFTHFMRTYFNLSFISVSLSYGVAGAFSVGLILYLTEVLLFGTQMVAGNRYLLGSLGYVTSGFIGGYFFGTFLKKV